MCEELCNNHFLDVHPRKQSKVKSLSLFLGWLPTLKPYLIASSQRASICAGVASGLSKVWSMAKGKRGSVGDEIDAKAGPAANRRSVVEEEKLSEMLD